MVQDDVAERALPPTERRRREARARGEVARSPELSAAVILLAVFCLLRTLGFGFATELASYLRSAITAPLSTPLTIESSGVLLQLALQTMARVLWPILLLAVIGGLLTNLVQTGVLWLPEKLLPRVQFGELLSTARSGDVLRQFVKLLSLAAALWWAVSSQDWRFSHLASDDALLVLKVPAENVGGVCLVLSGVLFVFALLDYGLRFWQLEERLKMTTDERRSEQREDELDPRLRQRIRSGHPPRELAGPPRVE